HPCSLSTLLRSFFFPLPAHTQVLPSFPTRRSSDLHRLVLSLPGEPIVLEADASRLEQAVTNLLNNAAKYTDPGGEITVSVERRPEEAVVRIRDTGIGIAPEMLPHVFDMFTQAERALDRAEGGMGVGLTLSRRLVELHGGRIEARSEGVGKGAEFIVRLPVPAQKIDAA